jgi:hypothetical protein
VNTSSPASILNKDGEAENSTSVDGMAINQQHCIKQSGSCQQKPFYQQCALVAILAR